MVFCQACSASNASDARFCNMCGTKIAQVGDPGGPLASHTSAPTRPAAAVSDFRNVEPGTNTTSGGRISLDAIGVRSSGKTYVVLAAVASGLIALGALGAWLAMRPSASEPSSPSSPIAGSPDDDAPSSSEEDTVALGGPEPAHEVPAGVDIEVGTPRRPPSVSGARGRDPVSPSAGDRGVPAAGSEPSSPRTSGQAGPSSDRPSSSASTPPSSSAPGAPSPSTSPPTGSAAGTGGEEPDWDSMEVPEDPEEVAMDNYGTHVRQVIREFYIRRAQLCFDHESRVDGQSVRGVVTIGFTIEANGQVEQVSVDRNTTGRESLGACLARQVDQWRLPPPPTEVGATRMQMPFGR